MTVQVRCRIVVDFTVDSGTNGDAEAEEKRVYYSIYDANGTGNNCARLHFEC